MTSDMVFVTILLNPVLVAVYMDIVTNTISDVGVSCLQRDTYLVLSYVTLYSHIYVPLYIYIYMYIYIYIHEYDGSE
jgi:hypothetical protein